MRRLAALVRLLPLVPLGLGVIGLAFGAAVPTRAADGAREVWILPTTGVVDGVMAGYLTDGLAKADARGRRGRRREAQHARRQPRRHPEDHGGAPRSAPSRHRVGGARRRAGGQRRDLHHALRAPRLDGPRHEHRRGQPHLQQRARTSAGRWARRS